MIGAASPFHRVQRVIQGSGTAPAMRKRAVSHYCNLIRQKRPGELHLHFQQ